MSLSLTSTEAIDNYNNEESTNEVIPEPPCHNSNNEIEEPADLEHPCRLQPKDNLLSLPSSYATDSTTLYVIYVEFGDMHDYASPWNS